MAIAVCDAAWEPKMIIFARDVEGAGSISRGEVVDRLEAVRGREVPVAETWVSALSFLGQKSMERERGKGGVLR